MQTLKTHWPVFLAAYMAGVLTIVALNSFDKVVMVNVWPSVLTAHGEL